MDEHRQYTVFVADDNPENLNVLSEILERAGYQIRAALNGSEMLKSIELKTPDLIILDIHMPELDGYDVCRILKDSPNFRDIPVVFCSALSESFNIVKAFEVGGVDYISKPFRSEEVLARVRTHVMLRQREQDLRESLLRLQSAQDYLIQTEKMASLGTLIAGIAHEVNNPINYIINSLEGFQRGFEEIKDVLETARSHDDVRRKMDAIQYHNLLDEMSKLLEATHDGAEKVHGVVHSLKALSLPSGQPEQDVDVIDEIKRAVSIIRAQVPDGVALITDLRSVPTLRLPPGEVSRLVLALLSNAVDALTGEAGHGRPGDDADTTITVSTTLIERESGEGPAVLVQVTDNGVGMDRDTLTRATDPFFTTKSTGHAMGLGLSTCFQVISGLGGTLDLDSTPGVGTTAGLWFPLRAEQSSA
jgi:signal transduction histidine kinase